MRSAITEGKQTLFIDQHGTPIWASSVVELGEKIGYCGNVRKQYCDKKVGGTVWNGYVLGRRWFTAFKLVELAVPPTYRLITQ